jgi:hypothetical protein
VVAVGAAIIGLGAGVGAKTSLSLASLFVTAAVGVVLTWYLNINANSVATGFARDDLCEAINGHLATQGLPRAIYSEAIQKAGRFAVGTAFLLGGVFALGIGLIVGGVWISFQNPATFHDTTYIADVWREAIQLMTATYAVISICVAWRENWLYQRRIQRALRTAG